VKGLPLSAANSSTPSLGWLHSRCVSGGTARLVRLGASCPSSHSPPDHRLPWLFGIGHHGLGWSHGVELLLVELQAHILLPPGAFLPPLSLLQDSLSLLAASAPTARFALRCADKMKLCLPSVTTTTGRSCVGSLEVCFRARVLRAQPPRHG